MSGADSMVTLQERLVNLINQLNMPILETSMVVSRWTNRLLIQLQEHTTDLPENLSEPWPLDSKPIDSQASFEKISPRLILGFRILRLYGFCFFSNIIYNKIFLSSFNFY